ncbi:hypothetical protein Cgig2_028926 [Carnegiea gigantea]|uniref:NAC domain-containing protein n=1 Tax=Carnegiea gigantea TaxID=171969 RepID=A0A9Q1QPY7_9CARY|nr:hypothetical protein Cgig2_028926 [Carnegiea gigantea]
MESTDSSSIPPYPQLPPGFRFHPTDEELIVHYLKKKASSSPLPVAIIADIDLYKFDPWELPSKAIFGEHEWYFFSPRDRKYPNGARPNRAATSGYWKATGTDKPIFTSNGQKVGVKKALVFYGGKPPRGIKTEWIMHEYRLVGTNSGFKSPHPLIDRSKKASLRLDDWVLCRIYKKINTQRPTMEYDRSDDSLIEEMIKQQKMMRALSSKQTVINPSSCGMILMDNQNNSNNDQNLFDASQFSNSTSTMRPASMFWDEMGSVGSSSGKRFHHDQTAGSSGADGNASIVALLNQIPQGNSPLLVGGSIGGDGVLGAPYQVSGPGVWNS